MSKKTGYIKAAFAVFCVISVIGAVAVTYFFRDSIIKYEVIAPVRSEYVPISAQQREEYISPGEIPDSEFYTLRLEDGVIVVYDSGGSAVYAVSNEHIGALTKSDVAALTGEGIEIDLRSELIEILNYLRS